MLANSFSFLPVLANEKPKPDWQLVADSALVRYLRSNSDTTQQRLLQTLRNAVESAGLSLLPARTCSPEDSVNVVLEQSDGLPMVVLSEDGQQLLGILTPFDLL